MENVTEELGEETQLGEITFEKTFTFFQLKLKHYEKAAKFGEKNIQRALVSTFVQ